MYAVAFKCKKAVGSSGTVLTQEGEEAWVEDEPDGWVEATAGRCDKVPAMCKVFRTEEAAHKFMKRWLGHPWYYVPNGEYRLVKVRPKYVKVLNGYEEVDEES